MEEAVEAKMTVDWSDCDLVESVAGKVGERPVVKGTRIPADAVLTDEELGATAEETLESFPSLSLDTIRRIRAYGHSHNPQLQPLLNLSQNLNPFFAGGGDQVSVQSR